MKTKSLIITLTVLMPIILTNAQIKLNYDNDFIGIGTSSPQYRIDMKFTTGGAQSYNYLRMYTANSYGNIGVTIGAYNNHPTLNPSGNNTGYLGYMAWWNTAYITNINYVTLSGSSDIRLKENIRDIKGALEKIEKIRCIKYDYKAGFLNSKTDSLNKYTAAYLSKNHLGCIAQQLDSIVPEVVTFDSVSKTYGIMYINLIPLVIQAMKE